VITAVALQGSEPHAGLGGVWRELDRLEIALVRLGQSPQLLERTPALHDRLRVLRLDGKISVELIQAVREAAELKQAIGEIESRLRELRLQFDRPRVALDCLVDAPLALQQGAKVIVREGEIRRQLQGPAVALLGLLEAAQRFERGRRVEVKSRQLCASACEGSAEIAMR